MAATTLLTSEQFLALPEELDQNANGARQELISGEMVTMPPPSQQHDVIRSNILLALFAYVLANSGFPMRVLSDAAFVVSRSSVFVPDVSVVTTSRVKPRDDKYIPGAPELAVEVVSTTDTVVYLRRKIEAYLANGSQAVWVVFPDSCSVMVHRADSVREFKADQILQDPLLPGFSVPVAQLFELT